MADNYLIATLRNALTVPIPWASVRVVSTRITPGTQVLPNGTQVLTEIREKENYDWVRTDDDGQVHLPLRTGTYIVDLAFLGDGALAPTQTSFVLSV